MEYNLYKIENNKLVKFKNPPFKGGDATDYAIEQGYKPLLRQEGTGGMYETETNVIIETPPLTNYDIEEQRKQAYRLESDDYFRAYQKNLEKGNITKADEYKQKWLDKVAEIDERFPYIKE